MKDKAFVDTNILVYLYSEDETEKQAYAYNAIEQYDCITSSQALNEFSNVCLKKLHMTEDVIGNAIDEIASALFYDCKYLLTEDLKDNQVIENNLTIINIFIQSR
ncbi:hypothetical protein FACS189440_08780 [Bacteroidia bacterium]|nr:hypothetical protein FACS189440_08780 [Bacteroidia bacterium]